MANVNKYIIVGRLTADPELRYTPSNTAVADLRLVTNRKWKNANGEECEEALFIDCTVWQRQAETCCQYLKKGREVFAEGYLKLEQWEDRETGQNRSKIKMVAESIQFLGSKPQDDQDDTHDAPRAPQKQGNAPPRQSAPARQPVPTRRPQAAQPQDDDDDIPF
jgi:single-strand DNA-binding protein